MAAKKFDFTKLLSPRAYTLMVYHRWKKIDEELFGSKKFTRRSLEQLQNSENTRMRMHNAAMEELIKLNGFTDNEAHKMLQNECERLVKQKIRKLKKGESFCGICQLIVKDRKKHDEDETTKLLHDYMCDELGKLNIEQTKMRHAMALDMNKKVST